MRTRAPDPGLDVLWDSVAPEPDLPVRRRSWPARLVSLVVVLAVLAAAAVVGLRWTGDADLRRALASSTRDFNGALNALATARTAAKAATAAGSAAAAAEAVERAAGDLGPVRSQRERVVAQQLRAEADLLRALGALDGVAATPLATWGSAHARLSDALEAEESTRRALRAHHRGAAARLADPRRAVASVAAALAPALVEDATGASTRLLKQLREAGTTGDLRALGAAAAVDQPAVAAAAAALPPGEQARTLTGFSDALAALSELARIDGERAGGWALTRGELARTFGGLADSGAPGAGNVRAVLGDALTSADAVIATAAVAIAGWRADTQRALAARTADAARLDEHATAVRVQLAAFDALQAELSAFARAAGETDSTTTAVEASSFLLGAAEARAAVIAELGLRIPPAVTAEVPAAVDPADPAAAAPGPAATAPAPTPAAPAPGAPAPGTGTPAAPALGLPDPVLTAGQSLVAVLQQSQAQTSAAGEALANCADACGDFRQTPAWRTLLSASFGTASAYASALEQWEAAVKTAADDIANRPLPAKPDV